MMKLSATKSMLNLHYDEAVFWRFFKSLNEFFFCFSSLKFSFFCEPDMRLELTLKPNFKEKVLKFFKSHRYYPQRVYNIESVLP